MTTQEKFKRYFVLDKAVQDLLLESKMIFEELSSIVLTYIEFNRKDLIRYIEYPSFKIDFDGKDDGIFCSYTYPDYFGETEPKTAAFRLLYKDVFNWNINDLVKTGLTFK